MLGLIFIYFIGKAFYKLSEEFGKNKWLYAVLGVFSYYVGAFIAGITIAIVQELLGLDITTIPDTAFTIAGIVAGGLACWGFYAFLKYQWNNKPVLEDTDILDDQFL